MAAITYHLTQPYLSPHSDKKPARFRERRSEVFHMILITEGRMGVDTTWKKSASADDTSAPATAWAVLSANPTGLSMEARSMAQRALRAVITAPTVEATPKLIGVPKGGYLWREGLTAQVG